MTPFFSFREVNNLHLSSNLSRSKNTNAIQAWHSEARSIAPLERSSSSRLQTSSSNLHCEVPTLYLQGEHFTREQSSIGTSCSSSSLRKRLIGKWFRLQTTLCRMPIARMPFWSWDFFNWFMRSEKSS